MFVFSLAVGPIQCQNSISSTPVNVVALILLLVMLLLSCACICYTCIYAKYGDTDGACNVFTYVCSCLLAMILLVTVPVTSMLVWPWAASTNFEIFTSRDCKFAETPFAALLLSYLLIASYCFVSFCCVCAAPICYSIMMKFE